MRCRFNNYLHIFPLLLFLLPDVASHRIEDGSGKEEPFALGVSGLIGVGRAV
jgi:hypothetical protein